MSGGRRVPPPAQRQQREKLERRDHQVTDCLADPDGGVGGLDTAGRLPRIRSAGADRLSPRLLREAAS
jgi:hypothetical protein